METGVNAKLPQDLRSLFWSYDFDALNLKKDQRLIAIQVINYGSWFQWKWLVQTYGRDEIKNFIKSISPTEFRPGALKLISILLSIPIFTYASRGAY